MSHEDRLGHVVTKADIEAVTEARDETKKLLNRIGDLDDKWKKRAAKFRKVGSPHAAAVLDDCIRDLRRCFLEGFGL